MHQPVEGRSMERRVSRADRCSDRLSHRCHCVAPHGRRVGHPQNREQMCRLSARRTCRCGPDQSSRISSINASTSSSVQAGPFDVAVHAVGASLGGVYRPSRSSRGSAESSEDAGSASRSAHSDRSLEHPPPGSNGAAKESPHHGSASCSRLGSILGPTCRWRDEKRRPSRRPGPARAFAQTAVIWRPWLRFPDWMRCSRR